MVYDLTIFNFINGFANHSPVLDLLGIFFAEYLPYVLVLILFSFLFWPKEEVTKNKVIVFIALVAALAARFIKTIILFFYQRPRPYVNVTSVHKLISMAEFDALQAFPSGHALFFFAISTIVYFYNKKLGIFFFVCSLCMGVARIFVGVHWPSDIIIGMSLGIITGCITHSLYIKHKSSIDRFVIGFDKNEKNKYI